MSAQVESIVGRPLESVEALDFEVTVTRDGDAWRLELVTDEHGTRGRRSLSGQSCSEVTDAAAVLIAMTIRGAAQAPVSAEEASPAFDPEPSPPVVLVPEAPKSSPAPSAPPKGSSKRPLGPVFGLAGVLDTAALPHPSPGIAVHAGATGSNLRLELEGAAFLKSRLALDHGQSADFRLFSGALLGCVDNAFGALRAGGCAGFELGSLSGEGQGVTNPQLGSAFWEAGRAELAGFYPLGHELWLTLRAGVAIPFSRPDFVLDGNPVYRPSALGFRGSVGVELLP